MICSAAASYSASAVMHLWQAREEKPSSSVGCSASALFNDLVEVIFMCPALRIGTILSVKAARRQAGRQGRHRESR